MKMLLLILTIGLFTCTFGQTYTNLEKVLARELPESSFKDGRWVFYADKANIEKIDKPLVKAVIPGYDFYEVTLTNYLGYHVNSGTCLVLYDSLKSKIILVEPLWYSGIDQSLLQLFLKKQFRSKDALLSCLKELNELMEIGSVYKFVNTGYTDTLVTYDLVYLKDDSYTTGGNGISSTIRYNQDGVWRQIKIDLQTLKIMRYVSTNPATKDEETVK